MNLDRHRCGRLAAGPSEVRKVLLGEKSVYAPDRTYRTLHVRIELDVDFKNLSVDGLCRTTLRSFEKGLRSVALRADGMRVLSARMGGKPLSFAHKDGLLGLRLPKALAAGEEATLEVRYRVSKPTTGFHFITPRKERPESPVQLWSQGQPEDAHYWFPCHDAPHEKATSEVVVTVPKGFFAVSNGLLSSRRVAGAKETFHYRMAHPHALYLVSVAVGRFAEVRRRWKDVDVLYYCEKGSERDAERGFAATIPAMDFFSSYFGVKYPYEKYAQVAAAEFPGGMENTTCTTQTDACLLSEQAALDTDLDLLVSHELAHHWFGDLVTCRSWSHAWLNEGFATYCEMLYTEKYKGKDEMDFELEANRRSYLDEEASKYSRPIVCDTYKYPWVLFDRHLYEKAGWVLHMLRHALGEERWKAAVRLYLEKHRGKSVETLDLIEAIAEASGRNLRPFFDQWIFRAGLPSYKVRYSYEKGAAELAVSQTQPIDEKNPAFRMPLLIRFTGKGWKKDFVKTVDEKSLTFKFALPGKPLAVEFDPEHRILKKLDFPKTFSLWKEELTRASSALSRARAAQALAAWGDGEALKLLEAAVRKDRFWGAAAEAARAIGTIRSEAARAALYRLLKIRHPKVRRAVVSALAGFPGKETVRRLTPLLSRDKSLHVQAEAARTLGALRDPGVLGLLKKNISRRTYWDVVAAGAVGGLAATKDASVLPVLRKAASAPTSFPLRAHAIRSLGSFARKREEVVDWIAESLDSSDERILLHAVNTLGSVGDKRAAAKLEALRARHSDTRVKSYVDEALARISGAAHNGRSRS